MADEHFDDGPDGEATPQPRSRRGSAATGAMAARGASQAARQAAQRRASEPNGSPAPTNGSPAPTNGEMTQTRAEAQVTSRGNGDTTEDAANGGGQVQTITASSTGTRTDHRPAPGQDQRPGMAWPTGRPEDSYSIELPPPRPSRPWDPITNQFIFFGDLLLFILRSIGFIPLVLVRYRKEYVRLIGDVTFGSKALAVLASTVMVAAVLSAVVGVQLALEGYQGLDVIGLGPLAGYLSAFANTRELTPLLTGFGLAAQMGCRFTSELGAMSVTDEIAALEVMSVPSQAYLVTTRIMAALTVTIPLFLLALAGSYLATQITVVAVAHQGSGTYLHYFHEFLAGKDIILATVKVVVFATFITAIHCFYGYTTTGGPENVGRSTGRAIRASIVTIAVTDMLMTILFYGTSSGIKITG